MALHVIIPAGTMRIQRSNLFFKYYLTIRLRAQHFYEVYDNYRFIEIESQ